MSSFFPHLLFKIKRIKSAIYCCLDFLSIVEKDFFVEKLFIKKSISLAIFVTEWTNKKMFEISLYENHCLKVKKLMLMTRVNSTSFFRYIRIIRYIRSARIVKISTLFFLMDLQVLECPAPYVTIFGKYLADCIYICMWYKF